MKKNQRKGRRGDEKEERYSGRRRDRKKETRRKRRQEKSMKNKKGEIRIQNYFLRHILCYNLQKSIAPTTTDFLKRTLTCGDSIQW